MSKKKLALVVASLVTLFASTAFAQDGGAAANKFSAQSMAALAAGLALGVREDSKGRRPSALGERLVGSRPAAPGGDDRGGLVCFGGRRSAAFFAGACAPGN